MCFQAPCFFLCFSEYVVCAHRYLRVVWKLIHVVVPQSLPFTWVFPSEWRCRSCIVALFPVLWATPLPKTSGTNTQVLLQCNHTGFFQELRLPCRLFTAGSHHSLLWKQDQWLNQGSRRADHLPLGVFFPGSRGAGWVTPGMCPQAAEVPSLSHPPCPCTATVEQ